MLVTTSRMSPDSTKAGFFLRLIVVLWNSVELLTDSVGGGIVLWGGEDLVVGVAVLTVVLFVDLDAFASEGASVGAFVVGAFFEVLDGFLVVGGTVVVVGANVVVVATVVVGANVVVVATVVVGANVVVVVGASVVEVVGAFVVAVVVVGAFVVVVVAGGCVDLFVVADELLLSEFVVAPPESDPFTLELSNTVLGGLEEV